MEITISPNEGSYTNNAVEGFRDFIFNLAMEILADEFEEDRALLPR